MRLVSLKTFVIFALAALAGAALLHTSQRVQEAEEELLTLNVEIAKEQQSIKILSAEWEYLNRPERLENLASEFLDLLAPAPDRMPSNMIEKAAVLPDAPKAVLPEADEAELLPASFENAGAPKSKTKPIARPVPPQKQAAPKPDVQQQKPKEFDSLLKEIGGGG